ncbi:MAG TPA: ABC transporter permease subunit [Pseudomonadota bacterium]|nr:ABC transporter permease subunit [Pseudomonadota bacterium]
MTSRQALAKEARSARARLGRPAVPALVLQAAVVGAVLLAALAVAGVLGRGPILNRSGWPLVWQFLRAAAHPELGRSTVALAVESTFITLAFALGGTSLALLLGLVGGVLSSEVLWRPHAAEGGRRQRLRHLGWTAVRALLAVPRAIHEMIWGLFLVNVLGLDPLVAVLAIALPFGAITSKVFGEIFDETPRAACEALRAAGASELAALIYGILPQALPDLLSYAFYRFECAIRAAALLGLIGAGGLGYQILLSLQSLQYAQIWTFLYALLLLGGLADSWSSFLRRRLQRTGGSDPSWGSLVARRRSALGMEPAARWSLLCAALLIPLSFWFIGGDAERLLSGKTLRLLGGVLRESWPPRLDAALLGRLGRLAIDTLAMSILAITLAGVGGLIASFPAAASLVIPGNLFDSERSGRGRLGGLIALTAARGILLLGRALSEAIWALLVLFILFPGVLPGAVALGLYNLGVLGRLMAAVHDNLDPRPLRSLAAQGASRGQVFFYGVLPQSLPRCLAYVFYRWEVCIRATVVVGLVGAGGLGRVLNDQLSSFDYRGVVTTLVVLSLLTLLVDLASAAARRRLR